MRRLDSAMKERGRGGRAELRRAGDRTALRERLFVSRSVPPQSSDEVFCFVLGRGRNPAATITRAKEQAEWVKAMRWPWRAAAGRYTQKPIVGHMYVQAHHHEITRRAAIIV